MGEGDRRIDESSARRRSAPTAPVGSSAAQGRGWGPVSPPEPSASPRLGPGRLPQAKGAISFITLHSTRPSRHWAALRFRAQTGGGPGTPGKCTKKRERRVLCAWLSGACELWDESEDAGPGRRRGLRGGAPLQRSAHAIHAQCARRAVTARTGTPFQASLCSEYQRITGDEQMRMPPEKRMALMSRVLVRFRLCVLKRGHGPAHVGSRNKQPPSGRCADRTRRKRHQVNPPSRHCTALLQVGTIGTEPFKSGMPSGAAVPTAFPGIRYISSSRRVMSATTPSCGTIVALGSSAPRFRSISRVPSDEQAPVARHGLTPAEKDTTQTPPSQSPITPLHCSPSGGYDLEQSL